MYSHSVIGYWSITNFKSVAKAELPLAPLTIFAGSNSSGKSSLLQSILLVAQTLSARASTQPLILNGHLVKLGQLDDLRNSVTNEKRISLSWTITPNSIEDRPMTRLRRLQTLIESVSCEVSFGISEPALQSEQLNPTLFELKFTSRVREIAEQSNNVSYVRLVRKKISDQEPSQQVPDRNRNRWAFHFEIELDPGSAEDLGDDYSDGKAIGCYLHTFLPSSLIVAFDEKAEITRAIVGALTRTPRHRFERDTSGQNSRIPMDLIRRIREILPEFEKALSVREFSFEGESVSLNEILDGLRRTRLIVGPEAVGIVEEAAMNILPKAKGITITGLPGRSLDSAIDFSRDFFATQVKYLGPLREEPKAIYPIQNTSDPQDVGLHGEHTAAVLHRNRYVEIQYIPTSNFNENSESIQPKTVSLEDAVFDWLEYLDIAKKVDTSDEGKFGYSLKVFMAEGSVAHDLTHVGVGVSQVLPIVVMCLLAGADTTIILEQPELHLNPKVQTRLADFFLSMAILRKQCLIETHSEYLINRLRLRSARAEGTSVSELLKLYFVEKAGGLTTYRDVKINEYGTIRDWPQGFFDQNQREIEAIIVAASQKS